LLAQACALILSNGTPIYDVPATYSQLIGFDSIAGLPWSVWIGTVTTVGGGFLLSYTVFGRYVYAIGSNSSAAAKSGVNVPLYTMLVYGLSGLCAARRDHCCANPGEYPLCSSANASSNPPAA
jgi:ribose/xylose/arabinose/galactoside ABC-type transport system permease subunit